MGFYNPSFLLGLVVLLYLGSFVLFAILRIATGVSIQRIGYFSLRRISYSPREGLRIDIRGLGLHLHRPTFAQPTWVSLRLEELKVTINVKTLSSAKDPKTPSDHDKGDPSHLSASSPKPILRRRSRQYATKGQAWRQLTGLKEKLKTLHEKINWLRLVDVFATNSSLVVENVGHFELGVLILAVDTRRKTVDRGRLFQHKKVPAGDQRPAEWMLTVRGVLFTPHGKDSLEIIDIATLNIHGLLYKDLPGLRDTSIALKLGRIHVPYDDFMSCYQQVKDIQGQRRQDVPEVEAEEVGIGEVFEELDRPGSREANIVQTVSDSKAFISSILRGIQEIQMAISFVGFTKAIEGVQPTGSPLYLNISMNEFGLDLHRLDAKSPAHRMYFSPKDVAHQALIAGISIGASLDDTDGKPQRILYVPMATATVKTTLPSKTVSFSEDGNTAERNANILFANLVVTSPSIDLDPNHLPIVLNLLHRRDERRKKASAGSIKSHHLLSRLLPKASIKWSVHEPVIRVKLPPSDTKNNSADDYDLLISMVSSISLETDSSHSDAGDLHYGLNSTLRLLSHQLYYQTAEGERHNLLLADSVEIKTQVSADPNICVVATANFQSLSVHMVRPEISSGVRQIVQQLNPKRSAEITKLPKSSSSSPSKNPNFLRPMPSWLVQLSLQGSNWSIDIAGVDEDVCIDTRGIALQLDSWTAEYKLQRDITSERPPSRRHTTKKSPTLGEPSLLVTPPKKGQNTSEDTDGRRLAIHVHGLEGYVMEDMDVMEHDSFVSLPSVEVAFTTLSDHEGPIFHVNSYMKALYLQYSLYRFYAIGVAASVVRKAFVLDRQQSSSTSEPSSPGGPHASAYPHTARGLGRNELVAVDLRSDLLQVKAKMPSDPAMMLQIYGMEAGQHRWAKPFLRSRLTRLYVEAPQLKIAWSRILSLKSLRVDLREVKRKRGNSFTLEQSFDIATDFIGINVPHQLIVHKIFDNFVNVAKATQQLKYRFLTGRNDYILKKKPEKPKILPRISVRSKVVLFDLEDGAFDWKLGLIYRIGLVEQKQRLAREEAFKTKAKQIGKLHRQGTSRHRHPSGQNSQNDDDQRSRSANISESRRRSQTTLRHYSQSPPRDRKSRWMRYDPEGKCKLSEEAKISIDDARSRMCKHNAQSWKKRIDAAYRSTHRGMRAIRAIFWGNDELPQKESSEKILALPERPGLMTSLVSDLHIILDKPSFPTNEFQSFMSKVGKGMPQDMKYSLIVPLSVQIDMGEARVTLRDYPLPFLHVPAIRPGQSPRLPSWSLKTDFVIAEEFRGDFSTKQVHVQIVPPEKMAKSSSIKGFAIDVRRTVSPVKTYSDVSVTVNTSAPTSIAWGTSLQPAIQDMMMVIEGFSKPQVDPSPRLGFWDKIRLSVHSRINIAWTGDGDVHLNLKGSRDPYVVTGHGAGFVMVWRKNVKWNIHRDDDPKKFMTVDSGEYVLAIPDFSRQAREYNSSTNADTDSISSSGSSKDSAHFKKTIMKFSGNVRWLVGLVFERTLEGGRRSFDFCPHHDVVLRPPQSVDLGKEQDYDAFKGFRSNWIHLSMAVIAPLDRDWALTNTEPSGSYNSVHLTPKFFTHFFDWWSLFSGVMSLPIRQGKLFPGVDKSSKKFGRHLATIKYNLLVSPVFITHMYKHKDVEEYAEDVVSATGLKLRLDSFMLDLHQRREDFVTSGKGRAKQIRTSAMKINEGQLDFISADLRAISARIGGTSSDYINNASEAELAALRDPALTADISKFHIPDNDYDWVDMDDFNELDWILPAESNPQTKILPLAFAPRFTYFRQTDHNGANVFGQDRSSSFGNEPTHFCVMSQENDPRKVQCHLIEQRLRKLDEQMMSHDRILGEQELHLIRDSTNDGSHRERYDELKEVGRKLEEKKAFLNKMLDNLRLAIKHNNPWTTATVHEEQNTNESMPDLNRLNSRLESEPLEPAISDFNNRFVVHNVQLKWNNSLRNIILRYVHQVGQRRGFIYYLTRRAVRFINDIVQEQNKKKHKQNEKAQASTAASSTPSTNQKDEGDNDDSSGVIDRINDLLNDRKRSVDANDPQREYEQAGPSTPRMSQDVSEEFASLNTYHVRLIAPQIQFQSEKNPKSVLLLTAKSMQLEVMQVMDKDRLTDEISGLVQRRFSVDMDSTQFFVTSAKILKAYHDVYLGNRYGAPQGSSWPPWVPFEVNYDFESQPFGWARVVSRTSATLRYNKYNTLRLKYNDEIRAERENHGPENAESRIDRLWIDFPHIRAICDSSQYYTMYVIVLDLLLYSEPLEKVRSERLEKIMLASDFSDLRGAPEMVTNLQRRIRQLEEIKTHFQIHKKYLDRQGWLDNQAIEEDLASCEDELFFVMKAITTSQRKLDDRAEPSQSSGLLRWNLAASEIVWHLMRDKADPMMEIQLNHALYDRMDNSDGSNHNTMQIDKMHGLNLLEDAVYPEMLGPYIESGKQFLDGQDPRMLKVSWRSLEAIAGIPVLDQFEVDLFPLKVQLERDIGQKLFEYIFPGANKRSKDDGGSGFSPSMIKQTLTGVSDDEDSDRERPTSPTSVPKVTINGANGDVKTPNGSSFDLRLRATTNYPDKEGYSSSVAKAKQKGPDADRDKHFKLFSNSNLARRLQKTGTGQLLSAPSRDSLGSGHRSRQSSSTNLSTIDSRGTDKQKRRGLHRSSSQATATNKEQNADDLSLMLSRASNYMTLAYVKIPSVVLCLSYKGKGERSFQDVHDFVFRMPVLEYRNKTWSNLDLALRLKKDVIRALISHTGAIIGNKFSHPRPSKTQRSGRFLPMASSILPHTSHSANAPSQYSSSEASSMIGYSPMTSDGRFSMSSYPRSELSRTDSFASSLREQSMRATVHRTNSDNLTDRTTTGNDEESPLKTMRQNLTRKLTGDTQKWKGKEGQGSGQGNGHVQGDEVGIGDDADESSNRKRSVLLLGKRILGGLNQQ